MDLKQVILPACKIYVQQKGYLNTIFISSPVPKTAGLYPRECWGYALGAGLNNWHKKGARPGLLEEIKALVFRQDPILFSQDDLLTLLED